MTCNFTLDDGSIFKETYEWSTPKLVVGNVFIGERYFAPEGKAFFKNIDTGDTCELNYKPRGAWSTAEKDL